VSSKSYGCALPSILLRPIAPPIKSDNAPGEGQSQPGTPVQPMASSVCLLKLLEEPFLLVQCDSDPGVTDNELQTSAVVRNRFHRYIYPDFSVLREFNRIPNQIDQDLAKTDWITSQVNGHIRRDVHCEFQSFLVGEEGEATQHIPDYAG
jgi:hypothetical protein